MELSCVYLYWKQRTQITFCITRVSTKTLMHPSSISTLPSWSVSWISMLQDYLIHRGLQLLTIKNTWVCSVCLKSALFSASQMACKILLSFLPINQKCQLLRLEYSIYTFLRTVASKVYLLLLLLPLLTGFLFGTALKKLLGKLLGLRSVPKICSDVIMDLIGRFYFLQERNKRGNCKKKTDHESVHADVSTRACKTPHPLDLFEIFASLVHKNSLPW